MNSSNTTKGKSIALNDFTDINRFRLLFESNPDAIFAIDLEGYYVHFNPACVELTGYSFEELSKMKFTQLSSIKDLSRVLTHFYQTLAGKNQSFECSIIHKDGHEVDLSIVNIPFGVNDEIVGVYGFARDISDINQRKQKLRESEELHRILTENSMDLITKADVDGTFLYVSPVCKKILGYEPQELLGHSPLELIHKQDLAKAIKSNYLLRTQGFVEGSYLVQKKNGSYLPMEIQCKSFVTSSGGKENIYVFRDISQKLKAEEEKRHREQMYHSIVEHSPDAVLIVKDGEILFINDTGVKLFGASSKDSLIGNSMFVFLDSQFHKTVKSRMKQVTKGEATEFMEQTFHGVDGRKIVAEVKGLPTIFQNDYAIHLIIRDISERKKTHELLINSEKLSVAGQLAAGIAHEIRNPITAIKGFLQLLNIDSKQGSYADIIYSEMKRIENSLSELSLVAKPQNMKLEKKDICHLLEQVKTVVDPQAIMNNVEISLTVLNKIPEILCDENHLKQVFINIVKNSIEAMLNGGKINIQIETQTDGIHIHFRDTDSGIPKEYISKLGDPLYINKDRSTGIGLLVSKQIIDNHKGSMLIESDEIGTVIKILLPTSLI